MSDTIYDVDIAADVKDRILTGKDVITFKTDVLRDAIYKADDNDLLRVGMTIDSPITVVSVDVLDAKTFREILFTQGDRSGNDS